MLDIQSTSTCNRPQLIDLPRISDPRGNLSFVENSSMFPIRFSRIYWINDVPGGSCRYGRALRSQSELLIALAGSVRVCISDATGERIYTLDRPDRALLIPPLAWRKLDNFTTNSVILVLASDKYDEDEYIRSFDTYKELIS